jgi:K+-transporting ATPase A subunit
MQMLVFFGTLLLPTQCPVASLEVIKQLGINGGGFFNVNQHA